MNCTPIGRPASLQCSGTDIAGCPVTFTSGVNGVNSVWLAKARYGSPSESAHVQPTGTGCSASVGVTTTSTSSQNATVRRAICWSSRIEAACCGLGVVRALSASIRLIGSSWERSSTPDVAGPTCQTRMKCTIISSVCHGGICSKTSWPRSSSRSAADCSAEMQFGSTGTGDGGSAVTAIRSRPGSTSASARNGRSGAGAT